LLHYLLIMKAYLFPGQGAQFPGMGRDLYEGSEKAKELFETANSILGFKITEIMFGDDADSLKQTKVTQPAIFLHSVVVASLMGDSFSPSMVAGHSLGEFSALVAAGYLSFEDGLKLVSNRAIAMQKSCEETPSTMAAVLGLENHIVEGICIDIDETVVPANYNCPGQLVISGSIKGIEIACERLLDAGARRALRLPVGGAFHSPFMESARVELEQAIDNTSFLKGLCPIYQNVTASPVTDPIKIKENLKKQLTSSVMWTQTMEQMINDGLSSICELGPGRVLQGLFKKVDRSIPVEIINL